MNNIETESKREINKTNNEYKNQINSMTFQHNIQREHQKQEFQNDINAINYQFQNYWLNIINNFCTYYSSRFNDVNNNHSM